MCNKPSAPSLNPLKEASSLLNMANHTAKQIGSADPTGVLQTATQQVTNAQTTTINQIGAMMGGPQTQATPGTTAPATTTVQGGTSVAGVYNAALAGSSSSGSSAEVGSNMLNTSAPSSGTLG